MTEKNILTRKTPAETLAKAFKIEEKKPKPIK